jgi:antitoxin component YwqK of YwqJK toxin-antitoxin module
MDLPTGTKRIYFPDGNMKARINFNDEGQMNGSAKEYYKGGLLKYTVKLLNGKAIKGYLYDKRGNRSNMTSEDFRKMGLQTM